MAVRKRVMIVEDSAAARMLLTHIVDGDPRLGVVAAVASAEEALARLDEVRPDIISMDVNLPGMDGLEATRHIMADRPTPIVVISASIDRTSTATSMDALRAGALSVVEKPVGTSHADYAACAAEIRTQLAIMSEVAVVRRWRGRAPRPAAGSTTARERPRLMLCAASTGGPQSLARLFGALPADWALPVLLVQHMGASFMAGFAGWLDGVVPQRVVLAEDGMRPQPGMIHVAPGDRHMRIDGNAVIRLGDDPAIGGQRPAATALIVSAADAIGPAALAVVLTGMGEDGADGVARLLHAGGQAIAEHGDSAIVNGMPAAAARAGATPVPLDMIGPHLVRLVGQTEPAR